MKYKSISRGFSSNGKLALISSMIILCVSFVFVGNAGESIGKLIYYMKN